MEYELEEENLGCVEPAGEIISNQDVEENVEEPRQMSNEIVVKARVGAKAPDFEAPAYHKGKFINVKLSDLLGKWVLLCFYPGDFTFV